MVGPVVELVEDRVGVGFGFGDIDAWLPSASEPAISIAMRATTKKTTWRTAKARRSLVQISGDPARSADSLGHILDVIDSNDSNPKIMDKKNNIQLNRITSRAIADAAPAKSLKKVSVNAITPVASVNICFTDSWA